MSFLHVKMLYLIWIIPILFGIYLSGMRKKNGFLCLFSDIKGSENGSVNMDTLISWIKIGLMLCVTFFIIIALSGPQYGYKWEYVEKKGIDIIIALDCSKSMLATDIKPNRFQKAKEKIKIFFSTLKGDRAGLVLFTGAAFLQCPLTHDYAAIHRFVDSLAPDDFSFGGTNISEAIKTSLSGLNSSNCSDKVIILITDGENVAGDPVKEAQKAAKAGVKIFCIGLGGTRGVPIPDVNNGSFKRDKDGNIVLTRVNGDLLQKLSIISDGIYLHSETGDIDFNHLYNREICQNTKNRITADGKKQILENRYQWFLGIAIVAAIIELFSFNMKTKHYSILILFVLSLQSSFLNASEVSLEKRVKDGIFAYEKGHYNKALNYFLKAQLYYPESPEIYFNLGNAYYKLAKYDNAILNYKESLKTDDQVLKGNVYFNLGNSMYQNKKYTEAIMNYLKAKAIAPDDKQIIQNIKFVQNLFRQKAKLSENRQNKTFINKFPKNILKKNLQKNSDRNRSGNEKKNKTRSGKVSNKKSHTIKTVPMNNRAASNQGTVEKAEKILKSLKDIPMKIFNSQTLNNYAEKDW